MEILRNKGDSARFNVALRKFLTSLQPAKYMCINECSEEDYSHYGLNFPLYTHFTSPIRRYADLLVHRLVTLTLNHGEDTRDLIEGMDYSYYAEMCSEKSLNAKKASTSCTRLFHCLMLKNQGVRVFDTLLFDIDNGAISIYIDEVNMHHKIRLREDPRIDYVMFFPEEMTIAAHYNNKAEANPLEMEKQEAKTKDRLKNVASLAELKTICDAEKELLLLKIFDNVKVLVETTTEFPLDIKCTLMFTK